MYFSQRSYRAVVLSVLLGVQLFMTPVFCVDVIPGFENLSGDYVLVHAYRFAKMYDDNAEELIWLPESTIEDPSITQRMDLDLSIRGDAPDGFSPSGLLKSISSIDAYETFSTYMQALQTQEGGFTYHEFVYDWRRSVDTTAKALEAYLQNIYDNNGNQPINVLAHSLGGPITILAVNSKPHLFAGCVFVGGAFEGGAYIYSEIKHGLANLDPNGPPLLDATSVFTNRPDFSIIPPTSVFVDGNGQPINIDPFAMSVWRQSTFTDVIIDDTTRNLELGPKWRRRRYLERTLRRSRSIYERSQPQQGITYPPFVTLTSGNFTAVTGYPMAKNNDNLWEIDYDNPIMGKGDTILPYESTLPTGFPYELITTNTPHILQFQNLDEMGEALGKLSEMQGN